MRGIIEGQYNCDNGNAHLKKEWSYGNTCKRTDGCAWGENYGGTFEKPGVHGHSPGNKVERRKGYDSEVNCVYYIFHYCCGNSE